jgi:ABC-type multidrug transport system fused ATPase/permease subunit
MIELEKSETESSFINLSSLDISKVGLHFLRQKTTIIPQDPVMFTGTIRSNIDPFSEYSNSDIVSALEKTKIFG